jgi:hypothetical protein
MGTLQEISAYGPYDVLDLCEALDVWADINDLEVTKPIGKNDKGTEFIRL